MLEVKELQELLNALGINTSDEIACLHAVLGNLHIRLSNLETWMKAEAEKAEAK